MCRYCTCMWTFGDHKPQCRSLVHTSTGQLKCAKLFRAPYALYSYMEPLGACAPAARWVQFACLTDDEVSGSKNYYAYSACYVRPDSGDQTKGQLKNIHSG